MVRSTGRTRVLSLALVAVCATGGCGRQRNMRTVTLPLQHIDPQSAEKLARPYVIGTGGFVEVSNMPAAMTVKGTQESIDAIQQLLERYDTAPATVQLRFQVIEADGFSGTDADIADVEGALRELFRFRGYRLAADGMLSGTARSTVRQALGGGGNDQDRYFIEATIGDVTLDGDRSVVTLQTELSVGRYGRVLQSGISVPNGQTVVLGSARPDPSQGAIILVVRPVITGVAANAPREPSKSDGGP